MPVPACCATAAWHRGQPSDFEAQNLANTAWAVSVISFTHPPLSAAPPTLRVLWCCDFSSQNSTNPAWSCAPLVWSPTPPGVAAARQARGTPHEGIALHHASLLWSFSPLSYRYERDVAAGHCAQGGLAFSQPELASSAWAVSILVYSVERTTDTIIAKHGRTLAGAEPRDLSALAWSMSKLSLVVLPCVGGRRAGYGSRACAFQALEISRTAWACTTRHCFHYATAAAALAAAAQQRGSAPLH
eukprot:NODE_8641_length_1480_cov_2.974132.p1 GENE.NODE_8641_length_1480_cov_2.974132~~NODE_8641_length_1480_cov_2.974132.p1  ORF type:complete len:244 (-),score=30.31 NODE_8641_length_1480_cov_2.974132:279-1010(-)